MTTVPSLLQRRYGHGAARLAIGAPSGARSLARLAHRPGAFERPLVALPILVCVLLGAWIAATPPIRSTRSSLASPRPLTPTAASLTVHLWTEPVTSPSPLQPKSPGPSPRTVVDPSPAAPSAALAASASLPSARAAARPTPEPGSAPRPAPAPEPRARSVFDASRLVPRAPDAGPSLVETNALSDIEPGSRRSAGLDRPVEARPGTPRSALDPRALVARARAASPNPAVAPAPSPLASLDLRSAARVPGTGRERLRPAVAAAPRGRELAASIRRGIAGGDATEGAPGRLEPWQAVPLEALPDCNPPGRQDALKQRILRVVSLDRECSHPSGRYRFVETRNLNAFLMYSRPNPDAPSSPRGKRDACDVLESALRCLGETSIEEPATR